LTHNKISSISGQRRGGAITYESSLLDFLEFSTHYVSKAPTSFKPHQTPTDVHERCGLNNKMPLPFLSLTAESRFKICGYSLESEHKDYLYILDRSLPWKGIKSDPRASPIQFLALMKTCKVILQRGDRNAMRERQIRFQ